MKIKQVTTFKSAFLFYNQLYGVIFGLVVLVAMMVPALDVVFFGTDDVFKTETNVSEFSSESPFSTIVIFGSLFVVMEIAVIFSASVFRFFDKYGYSAYRAVKLFLEGIYSIPLFRKDLKKLDESRNVFKLTDDDFKNILDYSIRLANEINELNDRVKELEDRLSDKDSDD